MSKKTEKTTKAKVNNEALPVVEQQSENEEQVSAIQEFEDICSVSSAEKRRRTVKKAAKAVGGTVSGYSKVGISHMDKIIKAIAILLSLTVFLIFVAAALLVVYLDKSFTAIAIAIGVVGVIISFIILFLIYGLGQVISQNNEILKRL